MRKAAEAHRLEAVATRKEEEAARKAEQVESAEKLEAWKAEKEKWDQIEKVAKVLAEQVKSAKEAASRPEQEQAKPPLNTGIGMPFRPTSELHSAIPGSVTQEMIFVTLMTLRLAIEWRKSNKIG